MNVLDKFDESWYTAIGREMMETLLFDISKNVEQLRERDDICPEEGSPLVFEAFKYTPLKKVKVVIVGQDPYHDGSFNGLAFGNGKKEEDTKIKISPSLRNVIAEVERTHSGEVQPSLYSWAKQGVLLINTAHTVKKGDAGSHLKLWGDFTNIIIRSINLKDNVVWMLWGAKAQAFGEEITNFTHSIIQTGHPSPLNRTNPFVGSDCFLKCNDELRKKREKPINWAI